MEIKIIWLLVTIERGKTILSMKLIFCDGSTSKLTENNIFLNMLSQVDSEVSHFQLLKEICDRRLDLCAIPKRLGFDISTNGKKTPKMTTVVCKIQVE